VAPPRGISSIVLCYAAFGALWILFSDRLVEALDLPPYINILKGWLFILATTLLLHAFIRRHDQRQARQQERLRDGEDWFRTIFDFIHDAVFIQDAQSGEIVDVNARMLALFGYTRQEALALRVEDLSSGRPPFTQTEALMRLHKTRDEGAQVFEWLSKDRSGRFFWSEVAMRSAPLGGRERVLVLVRDITERKAAEGEMARGREEAETASRAKGEFLAIMSHETRTPLSGLIGMLTLLEEGRLTPEDAQYLAMARQSADKLLQVINQILDFSRIESGSLELACLPFTLRDLFAGVASSVEAEARSKGLELATTIDPALPLLLGGDGERVGQVLRHLADNAVKFTEQGSVSLSARLAAPLRPDGLVRVTFRVADTGLGIPEDKLDKMFEPFTQGDGGYARKYHGSGLGLGIASRLARALGGELTAQSTPGKGTVFSLTLDLSQGLPDQEPREEEATDLAPGSLRLLVVEDERINQVGILRTLERMGHHAVCAAGGSSALDALDHAAFDAVLMDIQMPGIDGMETTRRIRTSRKPYAGVPIIALTAHAMPGDREEFLASGMDAYLSKPVPPSQLKEQLARIARRQSPPR
jgi:PAS domain S-box-containing protein